MLSYRHSFHAGNFADVIKHIVLCKILQYLTQKDTPFACIDTHAGAGMFDLKTGHAQKLQEYANGIGLLFTSELPELRSYLDIVRAANPPGTLRYYPGSPHFTQNFLRKQDHAWCFERHPADVAVLQSNLTSDRRFSVSDQDGYAGLLGLLPPVARRGLVLIDPPYEEKTDYTHAVDTLVKATKKFAQGIYALWYPVVERRRVQLMEQQLINSGIKKIHRFELGILPDSSGRGMTAAGMIVINPPWTLQQEMSSLLPWLARRLGQNEHGRYLCQTLVGE